MDDLLELLAADLHVLQRLLLIQAGAQSRAALVATPLMKLAQRKLLIGGCEIEVGKEKGVICDLPKRPVGDLSLPIFLVAGRDAVIEHAQRGLKLVLEDL